MYNLTIKIKGSVWMTRQMFSNRKCVQAFEGASSHRLDVVVVIASRHNRFRNTEHILHFKWFGVFHGNVLSTATTELWLVATHVPPLGIKTA